MLSPHRQQLIDMMEAHLQLTHAPEDRMFAMHPDEDHIIVSHALFWVMSKTLLKKLVKFKSFYLLRKFEEEMLTAYLTESEDFPDLLRASNVIFESLPYELSQVMRNPSTFKAARRLQAVAVVAVGYGGDMPDEEAIAILDDLDFKDNVVYSSRIEDLLPMLNKLVEAELILE